MLSSLNQTVLSSHEKCPICNKELQHSKYLNSSCKIAGGKKMSYLESVCNKIADFNEKNSPYPYHQYFQVTSLYGTMLFESVQFTDIGRVVTINHITMTSEIIYHPSEDHHFIPNPTNPSVYISPSPPILPQILEFKNRIFTLDYPKLEKIREKINLLAPFL